MGALNPLFTKNFQSGAAITKYRIVKFGADDKTVIPSAAVADFSIGVSTSIDSPINDRVDVIMAGIAEVEYGGAVTRGALLTTDASGRAVVAAPAAAANNRIIGYAMESGVLGDIGSVFLSPGSVQG
jgi:hypothetical protein